MKYQIDKQFKNRVVKLPFSAAMLRLSHVFMPLMLWFVGAPGVRTACQKRGGLWEYTFTPSDCGADAPCVMFFHGGGFGYSAAPHHKHMAAKLAATTGCRVIMLEYRLLPEHPYPAAREDAAAAYRRMCEDYPAAQGYAVIGDSAGGALAVYAAFDAQRQGLPAPKIELLLYPVLAAIPETESMRRFTDTPMWNAKNNAKMWQMYLGETAPADAAPDALPLPEQPPRVYIELAEIDCLHDEGAAYAARLSTAGAAVELHEISGAPHGFDAVESARITKKCMQMRADALRRAFAEG